MNYNIEYIEKLRIHELRDYARKLGVGRPTTLKKEDLLNSIFNIMSERGLDKKDNNYKESEGLDFFAMLTDENTNILTDLLDLDKNPKKNKGTMLIKKKSTTNDGIIDINSIEPFAYSLGQNSAEYLTDNISTVSGYVDIHPNGYGILRDSGFVPSENDSFFTAALVKKYNLKKGMFITGNAKFVIEGKPKVLFEISSIQDKKNIKNAETYESYSYNGIGEELYLDKHNLNIKLGERNYIENLSLDNTVSLAYDIVEENGVYIKLVNIKARPEVQYQSNSKLEIINVPFSKSEVEVLNTLELVIERAKREFELGRSNVIIIYNFCELIRYINTAYEGFYDCNKINTKTINKINNILYTAKHYNKDRSCTIFCIDRDGVTRDMQSVMEYEFLPLFNQVYKTIDRK